MANAFGIITALVLAAAAFFGYKNKTALAHQSQLLESEERKLILNNDTFEERKTELAGLEDDTKEATEKNAEVSKELESQLATNKTLQSEIDDLKAVIDSKKAEVESGKEKLAKFGNLDELKFDLQKLGTDLATLNGELLLKDTEIQTRTVLKDALVTENSVLEDVLARYAKKQSLPSLNASVSRVVSDLGFVILTGGDNAGIIRDSILNVQRGGAVIGKLKVCLLYTSPSPRDRG